MGIPKSQRTIRQSVPFARRNRRFVVRTRTGSKKQTARDLWVGGGAAGFAGSVCEICYGSACDCDQFASINMPNALETARPCHGGRPVEETATGVFLKIARNSCMPL